MSLERTDLSSPANRRLPISSRVRWAAALVLCGLAFVANVAAVPLFFGVDFLFGSIVALVALRTLGLRYGFLVALVGSLYTFVLWDHPWAIVIFTLEVLVVGLLERRFRGELVLADAVYWVCLGMPLVFLFYGGLMETGSQNVILVALKQSVNGIFNALVASLIVDQVPLGRWSPRELRLPLRRLVFDALVALVLFSTLALTYWNGRQDLQRLERDVAHHLEAVAAGIQSHLSISFQIRTRAVERMAEEASRNGFASEQLAQQARWLVETFPDFHNAYVADATATARVFYPPVNERGESTVGLRFDDRDYFETAQTREGAFLSEPFLGRGGVFEPIVTLVAPVRIDGRFEGFALGALDLTHLGTILSRHTPTPMRATLVDGTGRTVASSGSARPLQLFELSRGGEVRRYREGLFHWLPDSRLGVPAVNRWASSYFGLERVLGPPTGWALVVESPMTGQQQALNSGYIRSLAFMLGIVLLALFVSAAAASWLARPLRQLAQATTDLPERLESGEPIEWPRSAVLELESLVTNFDRMTEELRWRVEELEQSDRAKDEFLAMLSHELRNPMAAIRNATETLSSSSAAVQERAQEILRRQVDHLARLVDDLLDLSRITQGRIELRPRAVDVARLVREVVASFEAELAAKEQRLLVDVPDRWRSVVDGDRFKQILVNLLHNAHKYTPSGGTIRIELGGDRERVTLRVRDDGIGMDAELLDRAFDLFSQGQRTLDQGHGGLGIGLPLVRRLCRLHGGDVEVTSPGPGSGSTFTVQLPRGDWEGIPDPTPAAAGQEKGRGDHLLVVDDAPDVGQALADLLEMEGFVVTTAETGRGALERVAAEAPSVVLLDIGLPDTSGYEVARALRARGFTGRLVALTGYGREEDRQRAYEAGFDLHLAKPVNVDVLLDWLHGSESGS